MTTEGKRFQRLALIVGAGLLVIGLTVLYGPHGRPAPRDGSVSREPDSRGDRPPWRDAAKKERNAAEALVRAQVEALGEGNFAQAERLGSSEYRKHVTEAGGLRAVMLKHPELCHISSVRFRHTVVGPDPAHLLVSVDLTGQDRKISRRLYLLVRENGNYWIEAVQNPRGAPSRPVESK